MILARKELREYLEDHFISIPRKLEQELLDTYGKPVVYDEGHLREFSEQDIYEQVRKKVANYLK
ncbi:MAG: hypothetical protein ACYCXI_08995 [Dethiobacteraceae bacterium]